MFYLTYINSHNFVLCLHLPTITLTVKALNRMKVQHRLSRSEYIETMNNKYPKEVEARYTVGEVLGRGGYATGKLFVWF